MLLENFRSVHIILEDKDNHSISHDLINTLENWLSNFDEWYKKETDISNNHNLHFAYHRESCISGNQLLANFLMLEKFLLLCLQFGFTLSLRISLEECFEFTKELELLTNNLRPLFLTIYTNDLNSEIISNSKSSVLTLIENLAEKRINLTFTGSVSFWLNTGITRSSILNTTVYDIVPQSRTLSREFLGNYNPCAKKFMFVIDSNGFIYPCYSLVGIDSCRIGTIKQPLSEIWEAVKCHPLNLTQLEKQGPNINSFDISSGFENICELHRNSFLHQNNTI